MTRRLGIVALVMATFALVLALTFPTEAALRWLIARLPLPGEVTIDFTGARLRPSGLVLEDVTVTGPDGRTAFTASWIRLRPSPRGAFGNRWGRPWQLAAGMCQGEIDVTLGGEGDDLDLDVAVRDIEIASCMPYLRLATDVYGHLTADAQVNIPARGTASGTGSMALRGFGWVPGGPLEDTRLRADQANAKWQLAGGRLSIEPADASSSDFTALGHGTFRSTHRASDGTLDLLLTVTPGRTMPPMLRRIFDAVEGAPPAAAGHRTFRVQGTLGAPRITAVLVTE